MTFLRYVAMGDSFTEGVGDHAPDLPNGVRGWADRLAAGLADHNPALEYANLGIRGRKLGPILTEQLAPTLAMRPDLVTIYAGANDLLRPRVDIDALVAEYAVGLRQIIDSGARLVVFTAFDSGQSPVHGAVRGRFAIYNELVREVVDDLGATLVDYWRLRELQDWRYWDADRLHMGPPGHQRVAIEVLDTLGVPHNLRPLPLPELAAQSRAERAREEVAWVRGHALPWLQRRLTGRSSGDSLDPRFPTLTRVRAGFEASVR